MSATALLSGAQCRVHQPWVPGDLAAWLWHWLICWLVSHWKWLIFIPLQMLWVEKLPTSHGWNWQQILYQHSWWAQLFSYHFTELMGADGNLSKQDPKTPVAQSNTWISQVRSQTRWTKEKKQFGLSPFASYQQPASTTTSPLTVAKAMPWCLGSRALSCYYTIWKCSIFPIIFSVTPLTGSPDLPDH